MLRLLIALVLIAHGIGHSMGILQVLHVAAVNPAWKGDSWLLSGTLGDGPAQAIAVLLWAGALVGFIVAGAIVAGWLPVAWWQSVAMVSAALSLVGLALFPAAFPLMSAIGALAVDVAVLAAVFWFHWLPTDVAA